MQFLKMALMTSFTEKSKEFAINKEEFLVFDSINRIIELDRFIEMASPGPKFSNRH